jgi:hypothetical protein
MSVYSGFGTRQQESLYYKLLDKGIALLAKWCLSLMFHGINPIISLGFPIKQSYREYWWRQMAIWDKEGV